MQALLQGSFGHYCSRNVIAIKFMVEIRAALINRDQTIKVYKDLTSPTKPTSAFRFKWIYSEGCILNLALKDFAK